MLILAFAKSVAKNRCYPSKINSELRKIIALELYHGRLIDDEEEAMLTTCLITDKKLDQQNQQNATSDRNTYNWAQRKPLVDELNMIGLQICEKGLYII